MHAPTDEIRPTARPAHVDCRLLQSVAGGPVDMFVLVPDRPHRSGKRTPRWPCRALDVSVFVASWHL